MHDLLLLAAGLAALALTTRLQPMRSWAASLLAERQLLAFALPLYVLFGWPVDNRAAFRSGDDIGWLRIARISLFLLLAVVIACRPLAPNLRRIAANRALALFAAYVCLCIASVSWSLEPLQSLWKAFELVVAVLMVAQLDRAHGWPQGRAERLCGALLYLVFSLCVLSIVGGMLAPERAWSDWGWAGIGSRSMSGVVPSVNANFLGQLGGTIAAVAVLRLAMLRQLRAGELLLLAVGSATLLLAYSRTSIIAAPLIVLLALWALRRVNLLATCALLALATGPLLLEPMLVFLSRGQDAAIFASMSGRTSMWEAALQSFGDSPVLGNGFFVGQKHVAWGDDGALLSTTDSTYVETLVNLGFCGLVLVLTFALWTCWLAWSAIRRSRAAPMPVRLSAMQLFVLVAFAIARSLTAASFESLTYNLLYVLVAVVALRLLSAPATVDAAAGPRIEPQLAAGMPGTAMPSMAEVAR